MPLVTVDITGFYFRYTVNAATNASVLQVTQQAAQESGLQVDPSAILRVIPDYKGSIHTISVEHRKKPVSSQYRPDGTPFGPPDLDVGFYEYTDDRRDTNPSFAWQYYAEFPTSIRNEYITKSANRTIEFAGNTAGKFQWVDGCKIVWRLVGICTGATSKGGKGGSEYIS